MPETLQPYIDEQRHVLEAKAKAAVILIRLNPDDIKVQKAKDWGVDGIVAYSKICTHVGCPVGLYEQQTHHLLCPCHQSTFDLTEDCKVIFGPAKRPLPQLQITVDDEGYLVAPEGFHEAVGPSFWERGMSTDTADPTGDELAPATPRQPRPAARSRSAGIAGWLDDRTRHRQGRRLPHARRSSPTTGRSCSARSRCTR